MDFVSFVITCLLIELTPGPNMGYLAFLSSLEGRRAGFAVVSGVALGLFLIGLIALGGASAILQSAPVYEGLRHAGAAYLLWLAYDTYRGGSGMEAGTKGEGRDYFLRGFITNILNPKAAIFYITVFPLYLPQYQQTMIHFLPLLLISVGIATLVHSLIVIFAGKLEPFFNNPVNEKRARYFFTGALIIVSIWFFVSTGR